MKKFNKSLKFRLVIITVCIIILWFILLTSKDGVVRFFTAFFATMMTVAYIAFIVDALCGKRSEEQKRSEFAYTPPPAKPSQEKQIDIYKMEFEGGVRWDNNRRFSVSYDHIKDAGGGRIADFYDKRLAEKCIKKINEIDPRYHAKLMDWRLIRIKNGARELFWKYFPIFAILLILEIIFFAISWNTNPVHEFYIIKNVERVFYHEYNQYSLLVGCGCKEAKTLKTIRVSGVIKTGLDPNKSMFAMLSHGYYTIYVHSPSDINGGGWDHGKFGRGTTSVVE